MTTQNSLTGDYPISGGGGGGLYVNHYCTQYPCPICHYGYYTPSPVYINVPYPVYYPYPQDLELKEEVKELKKEIVRLRKALEKK